MADGMKIAKADMFAYDDSVDKTVSKNQGIRFIFEDGEPLHLTMDTCSSG